MNRQNQTREKNCQALLQRTKSKGNLGEDEKIWELKFPETQNEIAENKP
jgi:hypothetical protein